MLVNVALKDLAQLFDDIYAGEGRPSIPPERLLKAKVLQPSSQFAAKRSLLTPWNTTSCSAGSSI